MGNWFSEADINANVKDVVVGQQAILYLYGPTRTLGAVLGSRSGSTTPRQGRRCAGHRRAERHW